MCLQNAFIYVFKTIKNAKNKYIGIYKNQLPHL